MKIDIDEVNSNFLAQNMSKTQCHFKDKHAFFIPLNNAINPAVLDCK